MDETFATYYAARSIGGVTTSYADHIVNDPNAGPGALRNTETPEQYGDPSHWSGYSSNNGPHVNGMILASTMWDIAKGNNSIGMTTK